MFVSMAYGLVRDHVTATTLPVPNRPGKGLAAFGCPFRLALSLWWIQAIYGPGLLAALFLADNPSLAGQDNATVNWFGGYSVDGAVGMKAKTCNAS